MSKLLTRRQLSSMQDGIQAYNKHQLFINNHNRMVGSTSNVNQHILPTPKPLSRNMYSGKLYCGSKNGTTASGAAALKRTAKKRNMAAARASKR